MWSWLLAIVLSAAVVSCSRKMEAGMNIDRFWSIVESGRSSREPALVVADKLRQLSPLELVAFQEHFDRLVAEAYRYDLWGAAYLIDGGCSDDGFVYFRYGLIAKGKDVYEKALADPDSLADLGKHVDIENEDFGYVALRVYEETVGSDMPHSHRNHPAEPAGTAWDFDDNTETAKRLPRLTALVQRVWEERRRMAEEALRKARQR